MKKALILGITGNFGGQVAREMRAQGYRLSALVRDPDKLRVHYPDVELVQGNVADRQALLRAVAGHDIMVYGVNPANYDWNDKAIPWLETAAAVAEERNMTILFPGNVYVYDPADGPDFTEQSPLHPMTEKGRTRLAMEQRLALAADRGAQVIIIRAGDFIAADSRSAWLNILIRKKKDRYVIMNPGAADLKHTWAYLPDLARAAVGLIESRATLGSFNCFNFEGYQLSFNEIADHIRQHTGKKVKLRRFPWWFFRLGSPFSILMQGLLEMRYLWQREVNLKSRQIDSVIKQDINTPFDRALQEASLI